MLSYAKPEGLSRHMKTHEKGIIVHGGRQVNKTRTTPTITTNTNSMIYKEFTEILNFTIDLSIVF